MRFFYPGIFNYIVYKFDNQVYEYQNSGVNIAFFLNASLLSFRLSVISSTRYNICQPSTANYQLPTTNYQLPTANCLLPTAYCQLPIANCQPPTAKPPTTFFYLPPLPTAYFFLSSPNSI